MYLQLNASGAFPKATHVRSEVARHKKQPEGSENKIEDLMGLLLSLYQEKTFSFSEEKFNQYERKIRKAIVKEKIGNTLIISQSKNKNKIIMSVAIEIKKYIPMTDINKIVDDVEKEINKMEITE